MLEFNLNFFIIFSLISIFTIYLIAKYSKLFFSGSLLDKDFSKPQAFHKQPTARIGGLGILFLFSLFILFYYLAVGIFLKDYLVISLLFFLLGFLDDLKIKISPNIRLIVMLCLLIFFINIFSIQVTKSGLEFLNLWLSNDIFQICFVLLCFLFVINGANLVDGFNGLLAIHFLTINSIYLIINLSNQNEYLSIILFSQIIIMLSFLLFNFPKAKIFLGDSGSYLTGFLIALNTIKTYELNSNISSFFYASILFYLFFEVFFSFIRKSLKRKSPLWPDNFHLHMLLFKQLKKTKKNYIANYTTGFLVNFFYLILIIPSFYFQHHEIFSRYYFLFLMFLYIFSYNYLRKIN